MQRPQQIFYIGTYERDYPRNVLTIAALRRAGFLVRELHQPVWPADGDKSALVGSPANLVRLASRFALAYLRLLPGIVRLRKAADLVVVGYIGQFDLMVLGPLLRLMSVPVLFDPLVTLTDTLIDDRQRVDAAGLKATVIRQIDRIALRSSDAVLTDTDENGDYLARIFGVPPERVHVVPVGADETVFKSVTMSSRPNRDTFDAALNVLFYGNMIPLQGVETIVRAAKLLDCREYHFTIIGSGQTLPEVQALARKLGVKNVEFVPPVPYAELPRRIAEADVVLGIFGGSDKASRVVPNKVYQSMAMGAAIVTRDSPSARRLLRHGESALLVPPADPQALATAIESLADAEVRQRLGATRTRAIPEDLLVGEASRGAKSGHRCTAGRANGAKCDGNRVMAGKTAIPSGAIGARRFMPLIVWGSVALGFGVLILTGEAGRMLDSLGQANWWYLLPLLLVGLMLPVVHARRWQVMLRSLDHDLPLSSAVDLTISSTMINYAAPGYLWSPAKGLMARQMYGIGLGRSVPTLAIEQVLDALALVLGTVLGLVLAGSVISRSILDHLHAPSTTAIALSVFALLVLLGAAAYLGNRFGRRFLASLAEAGRLLAADRQLRVPVIGLTLTRWVLDTLAVWLAAKAVGISLGVTSLILISNLPLLVGLVSPMPGGIGFREGAMAGVAGVLLLPVSAVLAAAILHRAMLLLALPVVLMSIRFRRREAA